VAKSASKLAVTLQVVLIQGDNQRPYVMICLASRECRILKDIKVLSFLYGSQMLCCTMHCQLKENPKIASTPGISSLCWTRTEPQPEATCINYLVKIAHMVQEISSRTDRQIHTHSHHNTLQPLVG